MRKSAITVAVALTLLALGADAREAPLTPRAWVIKHASLILTMDDALGTGALGVLRDVDVQIEGDLITGVGPNLSVDEHAEIIDATGLIVMPGLIDLHTHLWQSAIRGCGSDEKVGMWIGDCVLPAEVLTSSQAYGAVRLSTLAEISTGVTTVVDFSHAFTPEFVEGNLKALQESGLRYAFAYDSEDIAAITELKAEFDAHHPLGTLQIGAFLPSAGIVDLAEALDVKIHIHLREAGGSDNIIAQLAANGALTSRLIAAHAIHLSNPEIAILAQADVRVVHNPLSNMRLASGVIHFQTMANLGMKVGLGQDGGTNDTCDMFNTMRIAVGLQRATQESAEVHPTVEEVLRMATIDAATILDMQDSVGSIRAGKKADLIIIDPNTVNFGPKFDWVAQLVFCTQPTNVRWVFANGKPLKAEGKLLDADVQRLLQHAQQAADAISSQ